MPHPSRPSTRRFQTTAALSDTAVWVCFLAFLLRSATCRLLACATVWICLFVLVLPSRPLRFGARFCPSCGLLPRPPKFEMECKPPTTPNTRCLNYLFYTPRNRGSPSPRKKERTQINSLATSKHCVACSNSLETGITDRTYGGMALIRLLQTLPRIPLRPNYFVGKTMEDWQTVC